MAQWFGPGLGLGFFFFLTGLGPRLHPLNPVKKNTEILAEKLPQLLLALKLTQNSPFKYQHKSRRVRIRIIPFWFLAVAGKKPRQFAKKLGRISPELFLRPNTIKLSQKQLNRSPKTRSTKIWSGFRTYLVGDGENSLEQNLKQWGYHCSEREGRGKASPWSKIMTGRVLRWWWLVKLLVGRAGKVEDDAASVATRENGK